MFIHDPAPSLCGSFSHPSPSQSPSPSPSLVSTGPVSVTRTSIEYIVKRHTHTIEIADHVRQVSPALSHPHGPARRGSPSRHKNRRMRANPDQRTHVLSLAAEIRAIHVPAPVGATAQHRHRPTRRGGRAPAARPTRGAAADIGAALADQERVVRTDMPHRAWIQTLEPLEHRIARCAHSQEHNREAGAERAELVRDGFEHICARSVTCQACARASVVVVGHATARRSTKRPPAGYPGVFL